MKDLKSARVAARVEERELADGARHAVLQELQQEQELSQFVDSKNLSLSGGTSSSTEGLEVSYCN